MTSRRRIKLYPNRRLYDVVQSKYITFRDLRKLVMQRITFEVIDHRSATDVTDRILLKVFTQLYASKKRLNRRFLYQAIRTQNAL